MVGSIEGANRCELGAKKAAHTLHEIPSREWSHDGTSRKAQAAKVSGERTENIIAQKNQFL